MAKLSGAFLPALVALLFVPGLLSPADAPRWAALSVAIPALLLALPGPLIVRREHLLIGATLAYAALSLTWTISPFDGAWALWGGLLLAGAFVLAEQGALPRDTIWTALALALTVSAIIAFAERFGGLNIGSAQPPAGLFMNKNMLAEAALVALVPCVWRLSRPEPWTAPHYFRRRLLLAGPAVALVLGMSRGVFVSGVMVVVFVLCKKKHFAAAAILALALAAALLAAWSQSGFDYQSSDAFSSDRFAIWGDTARGISFFGNGVGSFRSGFEFTRHLFADQGLRPDHAHNDLLELVFELGVGALPLIALAILSLAEELTCEQAMLVAVFGESLFAFPFHNPLTALAGAMCAGFVLGDRHCARDAADGGSTYDRFHRLGSLAADAARSAYQGLRGSGAISLRCRSAGIAARGRKLAEGFCHAVFWVKPGERGASR